MLRYARKKFRRIHVPMTMAVQLLTKKAKVYDQDADKILKHLHRLVDTNNPNSVEMLRLYGLMTKKDEILIDIAHKLAPYQTPKLESIEVKNKVEHRFVIKSPTGMYNVEDWAKKTGAEQLILDSNTVKESKLAPIKPSLHDFDEENEKTAQAPRSKLVH